MLAENKLYIQRRGSKSAEIILCEMINDYPIFTSTLLLNRGEC